MSFLYLIATFALAVNDYVKMIHNRHRPSHHPQPASSHRPSLVVNASPTWWSVVRPVGQWNFQWYRSLRLVHFRTLVTLRRVRVGLELRLGLELGLGLDLGLRGRSPFSHLSHPNPNPNSYPNPNLNYNPTLNLRRVTKVRKWTSSGLVLG